MNKEKSFFLLGVAHVSEKSKEDVRKTIEEIDPDSVAVELDFNRYIALKRNLKPKKRGYSLLGFILSKMQEKIGKDRNIQPGKEMQLAVDLAKEKSKKVVFADKNPKKYIDRVWEEMTLKEKLRFIKALLAGFFLQEDITEEEIEEMRDEKKATELVQEFGEEFPTLKKILVDKRNDYISKKIKSSPGKKVLAILGSGHIDGIKSRLESEKSAHTEVL